MDSASTKPISVTFQGRAEIRRPDLSVVVPSVNGWHDLEICLQALFQQSGDYRVEVLVPERVGESVRAMLRRHYPEAHILPAGPGMTIPGLRAMAFKEAQADVVAVIEDHVIVPSDWAQRMLAAHRDGAMVVGGAVDNGARSALVDWAAFLCEYSHCIAPRAGPSEWLAGNNVSYRRSVLDRFRDVIDEGRWENHLHSCMRNAGIMLVSRPEIAVEHKKHYTVSAYLAQRYLYARAYAGMRVERSSRLRKWAYGVAALALPPMLLGRAAGRVFKAGRYRLQFVRALPLLLLFFISWSVGEAIGSWMGPGDSLSRVC